ncbi:DNA-binding protein [Streptomyces chumphonensis]|uniref:DNA-binding protein n=1 Tax=Streptomyces chumphonensis TaxID=1214925 RepID=UPI0036429EC5
MEPGRPPLTAEEFARRVRAATGAVLALEARAGAVAAGPEAARRAGRALALRRHLGDRAAEPGGGVDAVLAELAQVAGWLLFDAERHRAAHRFSRLALTLARGCGERSVEHLVLATLSMQAAHLGRPDAALRLARDVLDGPRLPARVAAVFRLREAGAHALAGRRPDALRALGRAGALVAEGPGPRDPAWAWWVDEDEVAGHAGLVHAGLGAWGRAVDTLTAAPGAPAGTTGFRALFDAQLLTAQLRAAAWHDATELATRLSGHAHVIGSARATTLLERAARTAAADPRPPGPLRDAARHLWTTLPSPYDGGTSGPCHTGPAEGSPLT